MQVMSCSHLRLLMLRVEVGERRYERSDQSQSGEGNRKDQERNGEASPREQERNAEASKRTGRSKESSRESS